QPEDLGFSWEIVEAHVENWAAKVWKIARFDQFTGMALTLKPASESSRLQIFEVNSNPTKEATPVADERDEYKRDQQYLAAEREDQQQRILRADAPSFTEDDDQDDEHDYDEGPAFTEQDDPEDKAPAERDAPLPTAAAEEPTIENGGLGEGLLQPTALAEEPAAGSAEGKLNRNMQNLAKAMDGLGPKRQRVKPKPKAKKAAKEKPKPK